MLHLYTLPLRAQDPGPAAHCKKYSLWEQDSCWRAGSLSPLSPSTAQSLSEPKSGSRALRLRSASASGPKRPFATQDLAVSQERLLRQPSQPCAPLDAGHLGTRSCRHLTSLKTNRTLLETRKRRVPKILPPAGSAPLRGDTCTSVVALIFQWLIGAAKDFWGPSWASRFATTGPQKSLDDLRSKRLTQGVPCSLFQRRVCGQRATANGRRGAVRRRLTAPVSTQALAFLHP